MYQILEVFKHTAACSLKAGPCVFFSCLSVVRLWVLQVKKTNPEIQHRSLSRIGVFQAAPSIIHPVGSGSSMGLVGRPHSNFQGEVS